MKRTRVLLLTSALLLSACGRSSNVPNDNTTLVTVSVATGEPVTLTLTGSDGEVHPVDASGRVQLPPGTYTLTGESYKADGYTYAAVPQTVVIGVGETPSLSVEYTAITGAMFVEVSADGNAAVEAAAVRRSALADAPVTSVTVTGPNGYSTTLTASGTHKLEDLTPGAYSVSGPNAQTTSVSVTAGQTAQAGGITLSGVAQLGFSGLPDSVSPTLRLQSAKGATFRIPAGNVVPNLTPGGYVLRSVSDLKSGGMTYHADPVAFEVRVGETSLPTLQFAPIDGRVTLSLASVSGLTPGTTLRGPNGYAQTFTQEGEVTLDYLAPGEYALEAAGASDGTYLYEPVLSETTLTLAAGQTLQASATYRAATANLVASTSGLPQGASATLSLRATDGTSLALSAGGELRDLAPGTYTLSGTDVSAGGFTYRATPVSVELHAGQTPTPSLSYAAIDARLVLGVAAASGLTPQVTLRGPAGYARTFTQAGDVTLEHLEPGTYALDAADGSDGTFRYSPTVSSPGLTLSAGGTAQASVAYHATTGVLEVQLAGVPSGRSVELTGPAGQSYTVQHGTVLRDLVPGSYALKTAELSEGGWRYRPATTVLSADALAGQRVTLALTFGREDVQAPSAVSLLASAAELDHGAPVVLSASAVDNDSVASFELYEGLERVDTQAASASGSGFAATFTLGGVSEGAHSYSVVAVDASGLRDSSPPVSVTVKPGIPNHAPVIAAIADQVYVPSRTFTLAASKYFSDEDADVLGVSALSADPGVASVRVESGSVIVSTHGIGTTQVTVTVDDGRGGTAARSFSVTVGPATLFFSEYLDAGNYNVAVELYFLGDGGTKAVGYELELHQWNPASNAMSVTRFPLMGAEPGMPYILIDRAFYEFFDVAPNAWYYNDELPLYVPGQVTTALVLRKDGATIDVLGDPSDSARTAILPQGGTLVRNPGVGLGRTHFVEEEWTPHPRASYQFIGVHTP